LGAFFSEQKEVSEKDIDKNICVDHEQERGERSNGLALFHGDAHGNLQAEELENGLVQDEDGNWVKVKTPHLKDGSKLNEDAWPTQDDHFSNMVRNSREGIRLMVTKMLIVTICFWCLLIVATLDSIGRSGTQLSSSQKNSKIPVAAPHELFVDWPSSPFEPRAMACVNSRVLVADEHSILEFSSQVDKFSSHSSLTPFFCNLTSSASIVDVAAACDKNGRCSAIVLQISAGKFSSITDCHTGRSGRLLQEPGLAESIAIHQVDQSGDIFKQKLIAAQSGKLMQYRWSQSRAAWEPEWALGSIREDFVDDRAVPLSALATVGSSLFLFFNAWDQGSAVERRDLTSMQKVGSWRVSSASTPSTSACALDLHSIMTLSFDRGPRLTNLQLT